MKTKKLLLTLLSIACVGFAGLGLASCGDTQVNLGDINGKIVVSIEQVGGGKLIVYYSDGSYAVYEQSGETLQYQKIAGKDEYRVVGLGTVSDLDVVIPATHNGLPVTEIGETAFSGDANVFCKNLTSITIPDSVTSIGESAFYYCSNLTEIVIPNSLTSIGERAFECCSNLTEIVIPNSVTSIGDGAFYYCSGLTEILIPDSVTNIGNSAFSNCSSLTEIIIPNSVTSIGKGVFYGCNNLRYNETEKLKYLGNKNNPYIYLADTTSTDITTATIERGCKFIGSSAFKGCSSLTEIVIPDNVTSIGSSSFEGCSSLTEIIIPNSVTSIGNYAFDYCNSLQYNEKNGLKYLGNENNPYVYLATTTTGITTATIEDSCKMIGYSAFSGCRNLTEIVIPDSVTSIGNNAFSSCSSLTKIVIPNSVTSIGYYAFSSCSSLTEIVIPDSVTSIGESAFYYCSNLTIYCEAESQPDGWHWGWNYDNRPVVWGYKGK